MPDGYMIHYYVTSCTLTTLGATSNAIYPRTTRLVWVRALRPAVPRAVHYTTWLFCRDRMHQGPCCCNGGGTYLPLGITLIALPDSSIGEDSLRLVSLGTVK